MTADTRRSTRKSRGGRPIAAETIRLRDAILELQDIHDVMTVRQIFYALVSRGIVPKDENRGYRPVQRQVLELRKTGLLPWGFIADGTRWQRKPETWGSVEDATRTLARTYRRDLWRTQHKRIEIWLEKDALAGVVVGETDAWDVALMVSRGVSSATFVQAAAEAANEAGRHGTMTLIYTLFDFDAGGARAKKMIRDYFDLYADYPVQIIDLAVSEWQIGAWELPTRPAKKSDPQAKTWGDVAVELDAIDPDRLRDLVRGAIVGNIDKAAWTMQQAYEQDERQILERLAGTIGATA